MNDFGAVLVVMATAVAWASESADAIRERVCCTDLSDSLLTSQIGLEKEEKQNHLYITFLKRVVVEGDAGCRAASHA